MKSLSINLGNIEYSNNVLKFSIWHGWEAWRLTVYNSRREIVAEKSGTYVICPSRDYVQYEIPGTLPDGTYRAELSCARCSEKYDYTIFVVKTLPSNPFDVLWNWLTTWLPKK